MFVWVCVLFEYQKLRFGLTLIYWVELMNFGQCNGTLGSGKVVGILAFKRNK